MEINWLELGKHPILNSQFNRFHPDIFMLHLAEKLSLSSLLKAFWGRVTITWGLTILETAMLAALPLLIGFSIDGLLKNEWGPFHNLIGALCILLIVAIGRRVYDTRAYGTMRVELGSALTERASKEKISVINARLDMGRELVDFLEKEAPVVMTALIQVIASVVILFSFHNYLAVAAGITTVTILLVYGVFSGRFFRLNAELNAQVEQQVSILEKRKKPSIVSHLSALRRHEVRLSDTESIVYGIIFAILLSMLAFNLWFAATQIGASAGTIFSIVTYSFQLVEAAAALPMALQTLTRLSEITERINKPYGA